MYGKELIHQCVEIGIGSLGIVTIISIFIGAVSTIQTAYQLVSPLIPKSTIAQVVRDTIILEFAPTLVCIVLAGVAGSRIASELGNMRVSEQIDALEIMGINSSGYLVLPKIIAALLICPVVVIISMIVGITGGWVAGDLSGVVPSADYLKGVQNQFLPFNVTFAMIKTIVFAFIITSVPAYHGYYTSGGALEVGQSSTKGVVYSSILILIFDYLLTQLILA